MICPISPHSGWINITSLISCMGNPRQRGDVLAAVTGQSGCEHRFWYTGIPVWPPRCMLVLLPALLSFSKPKDSITF